MSPAKQLGRLYGIGVGPGDPELLTLKASRLLAELPVIFAASASGNDYSIALSIVQRHIGAKEVVRLPFPMTRDRARLKAQWRANARRILATLEGGQDAGFITLGDPLTYSTFGYIIKTLNALAPEVEIECIPGITSYHAAAARLNLVLAEADEAICIVPGTDGGDAVERAAHAADNLVILKAYRRFPEIVEALSHVGMAGNGVLVTRCGLEGEEIHRDLHSLKEDGRRPEYLSLIVAKRNGLKPHP